jgi:hypothetical protein
VLAIAEQPKARKPISPTKILRRTRTLREESSGSWNDWRGRGDWSPIIVSAGVVLELPGGLDIEWPRSFGLRMESLG